MGRTSCPGVGAPSTPLQHRCTTSNELVEMFEKGVPDVWDEYKKEHVMIKGVLITTITDLPGQGSLSREKTKGYTGLSSAWMTPMQ